MKDWKRALALIVLAALPVRAAWVPMPGAAPLPALVDGHGNAAGEMILVGAAGLVLHRDGSSWSRGNSGTDTILRGVWVLADGTAYAVGDEGTILRWDGAIWSAEASGTDLDLYAVWATGPDFAVATSLDGCLLVRSEAGWEAEPAGEGLRLYAVWGSSAGDVYVGGYDGLLLHWDGSAWSAVITGLEGSFVAISGTGPADVVVGTYGGSYHRWDGSEWTTLPPSPCGGDVDDILALAEGVWALQSPRDLIGWTNEGWIAIPLGGSRYPRAIWGHGPEDLFILDSDELLRWTGTGWDEELVDREEPHSLWSTPEDELFVGGWGEITRWDGAEWTRFDLGRWGGIRDVFVIHDDDAVAVGEGGQILRWDGVEWTRVDLAWTGDLHGVWAAGSDHVVAVGERGWILAWDGSTWEPRWTGCLQDLHDVWGASATELYAVGDGGTLLVGDGTTWTAVETGTDRGLLAVGGSGPEDIVITGSYGTILEWDGSAWTLREDVSQYHLRGLWVLGPEDVLAVGGASVWRRDGEGWSLFARELPIDAYAVWARSADDIYVAGRPEGGDLLHWDGVEWTARELPMTPWCLSVAGTADRIFVGAESGVLLEGDGGDWSIAALPGCGTVSALWGFSGDSVFAAVSLSYVGTGLLRWDGVGWQVLSPPEGWYHDLWGSSEEDLFVIGREGALERWDGSAWSPMDCGVEGDLDAICGFGPDDVWVVGEGATSDDWVLLHWDGAAWLTAATGPGRMHDLVGTSGDDLHAVGGWYSYSSSAAVILHWDGSQSVLQPCFPGEDPGAATLRADGSILAAGRYTLLWDQAGWRYLDRWPLWSGIDALCSSAGRTYAAAESGLYVWDDALPLGVRLAAPEEHSRSGEEFFLRGFLHNPGPLLEGLQVFFCFRLEDQYWFWDDWVVLDPVAGGEIDFRRMDVPTGTTPFDVIPPFVLPHGERLDLELEFYGAMVDPAGGGLVGELDSLQLNLRVQP